MTEFIYTGKTTYNGKVYFGFISVERHDSVVAQNIAVGADREMTRKTSWFALKKAPCHSIGAIYSFPDGFTLNDDGMMSGFKGQPRFVRPFDSPFTIMWQQESREVEEAKQLASREKTAVNDKELARALAVIQDRYKRLPAMSRRSFRLWLTEQLG